ncbi:MAG: hypothetical protein Q7K26_06305 [bacterium]|nr:hypothetical protein [bacterium]
MPQALTLTTELETISQNLIDAFDLKFEEEDQNLMDPIIRWLDYRLRYIDPRPRKIMKSDGFDARIPIEALPVLKAFIKLVKTGKNLNAFQTETIKRNDTSGTKRQLRTDGLWADWGIHHVHLTDVPLKSGKEFSARSDWLLFFLVTDNHLALIDVRPHGEQGVFQANDLVEKMIRSWPQITKRFELKGVLGLARSPSTDANSIKDLRMGGVTQMIEVDGKVYCPPGYGVTTAATSTKVSLARLQVRRNVESILDFYNMPEGQIMKAASLKGVTNPVLSFTLSSAGRLAISCSETGENIPFPSRPIQGDARSELEYLLLPQWAGLKLFKYLSTRPDSEL